MDIYSISQEQGMPIVKLMAMYLPDTTPAFKSWISGELKKIDEELQQQQQQGAGAAATVGDGGLQDVPVPDVSTDAAGPGSHATIHAGSDSAVGSSETVGSA